ncbi:alpha/beta hydrolase [Streptomyces sp. HNM0574]|uniref:alpha/beta fold hydrolase n=1 Tax=Streptomyces sp. HNM0574 TaxID=2714954 RepID=UPI00146F3D8C|nr:alpha/beta hydrolase [Streptomyces sp. HNM0574]NLU70521.1 alpha/beta hydrolase [Streptomyces sp. HNM0574]
MERAIQKTLPVGDGSWVTVDVYGDPGAPGLVVVPGAMSDAQEWRQVASAVAAWPSVAVVNRRGRAPSGPLTPGYALRTEVEDLGVVLDEFEGTRALFGWSYGGLIALLAADGRPVPHVIAYEPVMRPFGAHVLPDLRAAEEAADRDATVETVLRKLAGLGAEDVEALRADRPGWAALRHVSRASYAELAAINSASLPGELARRAQRVDLVVGGRNQGTAPYGTSFDDVREHVPRAGTHVLPGQGHLAHAEEPDALARLLDGLAGAPLDDAG